MHQNTSSLCEPFSRRLARGAALSAPARTVRSRLVLQLSEASWRPSGAVALGCDCPRRPEDKAESDAQQLSDRIHAECLDHNRARFQTAHSRKKRHQTRTQTNTHTHRLSSMRTVTEARRPLNVTESIERRLSSSFSRRTFRCIGCCASVRAICSPKTK